MDLITEVRPKGVSQSITESPKVSGRLGLSTEPTRGHQCAGTGWAWEEAKYEVRK